MQDPQSLHKYLYVHGDPVQGVDPTGRSLSVSIGTISIAVGLGTFGLFAGIGAFNAGVGYLSGQMTFGQAMGTFGKWAGLGIVAGIGTALTVFTAPVWGPWIAGATIWTKLTILAGALSIPVGAWRSGGVQEFASGVNQVIPPFAGAAATKYQGEIIAAGNAHGIPPELLAAVLTAERVDYSVVDWLLDDSVFGEGQAKHSIGLAQMRIDNMQKWQIRGWNEGTPAWRIRSNLMNHEESIDVLAEVLARFLSTASPSRQAILTSKLANWDSLSYAEREDVVFDFATAKDTGSLDNAMGKLGASAPEAFRLVRQIGTFAPAPAS